MMAFGAGDQRKVKSKEHGGGFFIFPVGERWLVHEPMGNEEVFRGVGNHLIIQSFSLHFV